MRLRFPARPVVCRLLPVLFAICLSGWLLLPAASGKAGLSRTVATPKAGGVLYQPPDPSQFAGYPRVTRLAHSGGANGEIIATFDIFVDNTDRLLLYHSTDDGRSWSRLSRLTDTAYAGRMCCATIFELPRAMGQQAAGTLLLAESAGAVDAMEHEIKVFRSTDHGQSWHYLSSCAKGAGGLWEPEFGVDAAGRLVCYFSDERQAAYSQFLGHVVSTDGGKTWSAERTDVAVADGLTRPGMATVVGLPSGRYLMSFEVCGPPNCEVHIKTSADGDNWGNPADLGERVQTAKGLYAIHTPYLTWAPGGSPDGQLLLSANDVLTPGGLVAAQSRRVLLANQNGGSGPWTLVTAPVIVPQDGPDCSNYSSPLLTSGSDHRLLMLAAVGLDGGGCEIRYAASPLVPVTPSLATPEP